LRFKLSIGDQRKIMKKSKMEKEVEKAKQAKSRLGKKLKKSRKEGRQAAFAGGVLAITVPSLVPGVADQLNTKYFDGRATGGLIAGLGLGLFSNSDAEGVLRDFAAGAGGALAGQNIGSAIGASFEGEG